MEKQILRRTFIFYVKKNKQKTNKKQKQQKKTKQNNTRIREIFKSDRILFSTLRYVAKTNCISFSSPSFLRLSCVEG